LAVPDLKANQPTARVYPAQEATKKIASHVLPRANMRRVTLLRVISPPAMPRPATSLPAMPARVTLHRAVVKVLRQIAVHPHPVVALARCSCPAMR